ncbi:hypothetical protein F5Y19DRAFT_491637 [Xylariaceae sp. FL1651]|nr:hypothetical protein F5Y19DRAFT_491637 [Xylariaceae sp. FL1651]
MLSQSLLTFFTVLQGVAALYDLPAPPSPRRDVELSSPFDLSDLATLKRSTHDAAFPLNWNVADKVLFSGKWKGSQLSVKCIECRTTGQVVASAMLPNVSDIVGDITHPSDIFDDSSIGLTFNGVGGTVDLDLSAAASGDFSMSILKSESPIGIAGPGFQVGVVFSVDLVLGLTGKVETTGGFKVAIPDGSTFKIPFDQSKPNIAKFAGASASLLPLTVNLPANVTVALRLKVQAGVMLPDLEIVDAKALAGAFIAIPEVILGESASFPSATCAVPVSAELNINAGVFVDIGADLGGVDLGDFNPKASTTLFAASTSTCLKSGKPTATSSATKKTSSKATKSTKAPTATTTKAPCPTGAKIVARAMTETHAITSCAIKAPNCPAGLVKTIIVEHSTIVKRADCPANTTITSSHPASSGNATTLTTHKSAPPPTTRANATTTPAGPSSHPAGPSSHPAGPSSHPAGPSSHPVGPSSHPAGPSSHPAGPSSFGVAARAYPMKRNGLAITLTRLETPITQYMPQVPSPTAPAPSIITGRPIDSEVFVEDGE